MKKETLIRIVICLLSLVMIVWLVACGAPVVDGAGYKEPEMPFERVPDYYNQFQGQVVYMKETKVMYFVSGANYNFGTMTLLVNADGTPMLWDVDTSN